MTTFRDYAGTWTDNVLPLKQPRSISTMRSHIKTLNEGLGSKPLPIPFNEVQGFFTELAGKVSSKSVKNVYATFRTIMAQAEREGVISTIPKPVLPKIRRQPQPWFTLDQVRGLIGFSGGEQTLLFCLLAETGMRIEEALGLEPQDLDLKNGRIRVRRNLKTDESRRTVSISNSLRELAEKHLGLFSTMFSRSETWWRNKLKETMEAAGVGEGSFHSFRRFNITISASIGMPAEILKQRVGHSQGDLTFGLYNQQQLPDKEWAEKLGGLLQ